MPGAGEGGAGGEHSASGEQPDLLHEAAAELYWADPADFVERRGVLVAQARAAGQASAAKSIAALRKPTRSAWVINRLIRSDPDVTSRLVGLGDELRAAQGSLDGAAIRELSTRRRQLIAELSRQAFTASDLRSPPVAVRDEVNATLGAALADPQLAGQLAAGTLERPAQAEGFGPAGPAGAPVLTVLPGGQRTQAPAKAAPRPARRGTAQERAEAAAQARAEAAAREQAERERRRQAALAEADRTVAEADTAAAAASTAELDLEAAVERLEQELADARQGLTDARLAARRARNRQRQARQARDRLQGPR
jgi:hypothetical protein